MTCRGRCCCRWWRSCRWGTGSGRGAWICRRGRAGTQTRGWSRPWTASWGSFQLSLWSMARHLHSGPGADTFSAFWTSRHLNLYFDWWDYFRNQTSLRLLSDVWWFNSWGMNMTLVRSLFFLKVSCSSVCKLLLTNQYRTRDTAASCTFWAAIM